MAEAIDASSAEPPAVLFYGASLFVTSALITTIARYAAARTELLREGVPPAEAMSIAAITTPSLGFYAVVLLLALLAPVVAAFGFFAVALIAVLQVRGDRREAPAG